MIITDLHESTEWHEDASLALDDSFMGYNCASYCITLNDQLNISQSKMIIEWCHDKFKDELTQVRSNEINALFWWIIVAMKNDYWLCKKFTGVHTQEWYVRHKVKAFQEFIHNKNNSLWYCDQCDLVSMRIFPYDFLSLMNCIASFICKRITRYSYRDKTYAVTVAKRI